MNIYVKILLIIAGLAYLINPFDIIPDLFIPIVGWIDDTVILGVLLYLLRYGTLPNIFKKDGKKGKFARTFFRGGPSYSNYRDNSHQKGYTDSDPEKEASRQQEKSEARPKDPYQVLGVDRNATREEIQSAYREKVKQYHPDRVSQLGEELQEMANRKFVEIKDAYDTLMKRFE